MFWPPCRRHCCSVRTIESRNAEIRTGNIRQNSEVETTERRERERERPSFVPSLVRSSLRPPSDANVGEMRERERERNGSFRFRVSSPITRTKGNRSREGAREGEARERARAPKSHMLMSAAEQGRQAGISTVPLGPIYAGEEIFILVVVNYQIGLLR